VFDKGMEAWKQALARAGIETKFLSKPIIAPPGTACTETYLVAGHLTNEVEAARYAKYLRTRFVRFLVSLRKSAQDAAKGVYRFVPDLSLDQEWTDAKLYRKYKLTRDEIAFIESQVAPADLPNAGRTAGHRQRRGVRRVRPQRVLRGHRHR